jgi:hypothetical protein
LELGLTVPNPSVGADVRLVISLPDERPTHLEVLDVAGRKVMSREVGSLGAGRHAVALSGDRRLSPGVYVVRLLRSDRSVERKLVLTR